MNLPENKVYESFGLLFELRGKKIFRPMPTKCEGAFEVVSGKVITARLSDEIVRVYAFFSDQSCELRRGKVLCKRGLHPKKEKEYEKPFFLDPKHLRHLVVETQGWVKEIREKEDSKRERARWLGSLR